MSLFAPRKTFVLAFICLICHANALKCRTGDETQPNEDFEYVVRMCLRQLKNATRHENIERNVNTMFDMDRNRNDRERMYGKRRGGGNQSGSNGDGFEYFWGPNGNGNGNSGRDHREKDMGREQQRGDYSRDKMDGDYMEDSDYFHFGTSRNNGYENKMKIRPRPHSYQQQVQHDRDMMYGYGHRDSPYGYQSTERNKKRTSYRSGDSPLEQLDPCMIHCIFQEMQMLDENGKPDKSTVAEKMSQKIRNPELKSFIRDSVDECFDMIDEEASNSRFRGSDFMCVWSKNFAICLEEKGKESCDDWNDPLGRNSKSREDQKNKNKGSKGGNNRG